MSFVVHRTEEATTSGMVLVDDGISADSFSANKFAVISVEYSSGQIDFNLKYGVDVTLPTTMTFTQLQEVIILDALDLGNVDSACYISSTKVVTLLKSEFNPYSLSFHLNLESADTVIDYSEGGQIKFGNVKSGFNACL